MVIGLPPVRECTRDQSSAQCLGPVSERALEDRPANPASRAVLEPLLVLMSPYAPHIAEELWSQLGHLSSIAFVEFPKFEASYLVESTKNYPISFNGKMRFTMQLSLELNKEEIEAAVLADEKTQAQLQGRTPKKVIVVPGKIVNIVG